MFVFEGFTSVQENFYLIISITETAFWERMDSKFKGN